jgi:hypothetical protein
LPHHEGNKMKGGVWPTVRLKVIALAVAGTLAGTLGSKPVHAEPSASEEHAENPHPPHSHYGRLPHPAHESRGDHPASDVVVRTAVPPDLDQQRRDGHMTPEERRLLRQHIEDAVRELYKR